MSADRHGRYYWCVKTPLSSNGEIYRHADGLSIRQQWQAAFAASCIDGHAVAGRALAGRGRAMRSALVTSFDPATDPQAPSDYAIRAIIDGLDQVAFEMERKWGVGRLRLLVSDLLRAKFDAQKDKLDAAIATNQEHYIRAQAEGMKRAWAALDKAASEAGHPPLSR